MCASTINKNGESPSGNHNMLEMNFTMTNLVLISIVTKEENLSDYLIYIGAAIGSIFAILVLCVRRYFRVIPEVEIREVIKV